eukprot:8198740-Alexandrium_andersonii.AAC.1
MAGRSAQEARESMSCVSGSANHLRRLLRRPTFSRRWLSSEGSANGSMIRPAAASTAASSEDAT